MELGSNTSEVDDNFEEIVLFLTNLKNMVKNAVETAEELFHYDDLYEPAIKFEEFWEKMKDCGIKEDIYKHLSAVIQFLTQELYHGNMDNADQIHMKFVPVYEVLVEFSKSTILNNTEFRKIVTYFIKEVLKVIGYASGDTYPQKVLIFQLSRHMAFKLGQLKGFAVVVFNEIHVKISTMIGYFEEDPNFQLDGIQVNCLMYYLVIVKEILLNRNCDEVFEGTAVDTLKYDLDRVEEVIKRSGCIPTFVISLVYEIYKFL